MKLKYSISVVLVSLSCFNSFLYSNYGNMKSIRLDENSKVLYNDKELNKILASRTANFLLQEPIFTQTPSAENSRGYSIRGYARLYDYTAVKASVQKKYLLNPSDTLYSKFEQKYNEQYNLDEYVRIEVTLTAFDFDNYTKSEFWTIYLIDGLKNRIEINKTDDEKNIKRRERRIRFYDPRFHNMRYFLYSNSFNLYIRKKDFYGLNLLDKKRKYISLVFSYDGKIKGKAYWYFK